MAIESPNSVTTASLVESSTTRDAEAYRWYLQTKYWSQTHQRFSIATFYHPQSTCDAMARWVPKIETVLSLDRLISTERTDVESISCILANTTEAQQIANERLTRRCEFWSLFYVWKWKKKTKTTQKHDSSVIETNYLLCPLIHWWFVSSFHPTTWRLLSSSSAMLEWITSGVSVTDTPLYAVDDIHGCVLEEQRQGPWLSFIDVVIIASDRVDKIFSDTNSHSSSLERDHFQQIVSSWMLSDWFFGELLVKVSSF